MSNIGDSDASLRRGDWFLKTSKIGPVNTRHPCWRPPHIPCGSDAGLQAVPPLSDEQGDPEEDEDLKQQQVLEGLPWAFTITSKPAQNGPPWILPSGLP